jgi:hypothetical protein
MQAIIASKFVTKTDMSVKIMSVKIQELFTVVIYADLFIICHGAQVLVLATSAGPNTLHPV